MEMTRTRPCPFAVPFVVAPFVIGPSPVDGEQGCASVWIDTSSGFAIACVEMVGAETAAGAEAETDTEVAAGVSPTAGCPGVAVAAPEGVLAGLRGRGGLLAVVAEGSWDLGCCRAPRRWASQSRKEVG